MCTDMGKLREKMLECKISIESLAKKLGIDASTFYRKLKCDGMTFTVGQMHEIVKILGLSSEEASSIFLWQNSQ